MAFPNSEQASRPNTTDLRFAEVVRRLDGQDKMMEKLVTGTDALREIANRIERAQIENIGQVKADIQARKVEEERLDKLILHKAATSIDRDKQQVIMIQDEEKARQSDVAVLNGKIDKITDKLGDVFVTNRIILFLTTAVVLAVIAGVISGRIGVVLTP